MASRDITMWKDLAERLKAHQSYSITRTSLARQIEQESPAYSLELIQALCNELQCLPNDLFQIEISDATADDIRKLTRRERPFEFGHIMEGETAHQSEPQGARKPPIVSEGDAGEEDELVGGRISHLSAGKLKK